MNEGARTCGNPSRGRYNMGCRCFACRVANADYEHERAHRPDRCRTTPMVGEKGTGQARQRVLGWLEDGYSLREICRATGVSRSAMRTLVYGKHPNGKAFKDGRPKMTRRMKRENYKAIMLCRSPESTAPGAYVDAGPVNDAMAWLDAHGVKRAHVARVAGIPSATIYQLGKRKLCRHETAVKLARVAERLKEEAMKPC